MANRAAPARSPRMHPSVPEIAVERMRTSLRKPFSISSTYRWLTVAALLFGIFISVEWQAPSAKSPASQDYPRELGRESVRRLEAEQKELKLVIAEYQTELASLQKDAAGRKSALAGLNTELENQRELAGLVPLTGAGVSVTLDDSQVKSIPTGEDPAHYIIHDYDLRDTVSLLWQSGAEAMAISGERIVASTSIYCVGSTILVNDVRLSPPYKIVALGPPSMEESLNSQARLQKLKQSVRQYGVQLKVASGKELQLPSFSGRFTTRFAAPGGGQ